MDTFPGLGGRNIPPCSNRPSGSKLPSRPISPSHSLGAGVASPPNFAWKLLPQISLAFH
jgi:hypothetical protein